MEETVSALLANTAALGVWLLGRPVVVDNQPQRNVLAGAVNDPAINPPIQVWVERETYLELEGWQLFAEPIGGATLVIIFDDRSSLGLIRLRVRHARPAIERALTTLGD